MRRSSRQPRYSGVPWLLSTLCSRIRPVCADGSMRTISDIPSPAFSPENSPLFSSMESVSPAGTVRDASSPLPEENTESSQSAIRETVS